MLSLGLWCQENNTKQLLYSFSYIPPYLFSYQGEFLFASKPINFEANIHYKPYDRISFTTGLGYYTWTETHYVSWTTPSEYYYKSTESNIRVVVQLFFCKII